MCVQGWAARCEVVRKVGSLPERESGKRKGVGFMLDQVQKMGDGKSFGGKKPVDQVFGPVGGAGRAAPADEEDEQDFK